MTTDEVIAAVRDFNPNLPCVELLPSRPGNCRGAGLRWCYRTRELALVNTKRADRRYVVTELVVERAEFGGRAFRLAKLTTGTDPEAADYTALVSDHGPGHDSCECRGFLRHGHCSHLDAIRSIIANGWIQDSAEVPVSAPVTEAELDDMAARACYRPVELPTDAACCLCRQPLNPADADKSGMAHEACAQQEFADQDAGDDDTPEWGREGGIGERADVPF